MSPTHIPIAEWIVLPWAIRRELINKLQIPHRISMINSYVETDGVKQDALDKIPNDKLKELVGEAGDNVVLFRELAYRLQNPHEVRINTTKHVEESIKPEREEEGGSGSVDEASLTSVTHEDDREVSLPDTGADSIVAGSDEHADTNGNVSEHLPEEGSIREEDKGLQGGEGDRPKAKKRKGASKSD
jgi:hypothetical protein